MIVSLLVFVTIVALAVPAAVVLIPFTLLSGNVGPLFAVGCWITRVAIRVAGIRIQIQGRKIFPQAAPASSWPTTSPISMRRRSSSNLPGRTVVFLKRPLMKIPILGYAFKLASFIPVDRDGTVESAQLAVEEAQRVLASGLHITAFVEGMRSPDGRMQPFKKGTFYLAKDSGAPCIPVSIFGTEKILPVDSKRIYPGVVHIAFHAPIDPANFATRDELSEAVRAAIASGLPKWMRG